MPVVCPGTIRAMLWRRLMMRYSAAVEKLVASPDNADAVILPRARMLSTDQGTRLLGNSRTSAPFGPRRSRSRVLSPHSQGEANRSAKFAASIYDTDREIRSARP